MADRFGLPRSRPVVRSSRKMQKNTTITVVLWAESEKPERFLASQADGNPHHPAIDRAVDRAIALKASSSVRVRVEEDRPGDPRRQGLQPVLETRTVEVGPKPLVVRPGSPA